MVFVLFHGFLLHAEDYIVDFLAFGLVIAQLIVQNHLELLESPVEGICSFIFSDLLPCSLDVGHLARIKTIHIAVDHDRKVGSSNGFPLIHLGPCIGHDLISEFINARHKLSSQGVFWQLVESLQFVLIIDWLHEGEAIAKREEVDNGFLDLFRILTRFRTPIVEAILEILRRCNCSTSIVLYFEHEIT
jgi:hypothetical protein